MTDEEKIELETLEQRLKGLLEQHNEKMEEVTDIRKQVIAVKGEIADLQGASPDKLNVSVDEVMAALQDFFSAESTTMQSDKDTELPLYTTINKEDGHVLQVLGVESNISFTQLFARLSGDKEKDAKVDDLITKFLEIIFQGEFQSVPWAKVAIGKIIKAVDSGVKSGKKLKRFVETEGKFLTIQYHKKQTTWEVSVRPAKERKNEQTT